MMRASLIAGAGLICLTMLAIGFGLVVPVSSAVGDMFDVLAVASGVFFVGLLDGEWRPNTHEFRWSALPSTFRRPIGSRSPAAVSALRQPSLSASGARIRTRR